MSKVKLGTVIDSCLGKMLDAAKNKGEYEPYLANLNVRWGDFDLDNLSQMRFESYEQERYGIKYGDLIMCEGGEPGRCAIWRDELPNMKIQKALHRIRPHDCLDVRYLYYWFLLAGKNGWLNRYFTETTIKHLPGDSLKDVEIDLIDLPLQKGIADVLSSLDDKIRHNNRICRELEAMAKTIYDYWFVQFDFPDENGKPYRASGGEMVWNEQLKQKVPKGWGVTTIGRIADNFDSQRVPLSQNQRENIQGTIPYYGATGIMDYINSYIFDGQYVLIAEDGSVMDDFGHPIVQMIWDKTWVNNHAHVLQGHDYYSNEILYFILKGIPVVKIMTGSIQKKINQDNLNNYLFPSIPQKILDQFHLFVKDVFEQIHQLELESKELTKLRDWLLPMLMNGQARVQ